MDPTVKQRTTGPCVSRKARSELKVPEYEEDILKYSLLSPEEPLNQKNNVPNNRDSSAVISRDTEKDKVSGKDGGVTSFGKRFWSLSASHKYSPAVICLTEHVLYIDFSKPP